MVVLRLTGDKGLDRTFRRLPQAVQTRLEGQAIRAGLRVADRSIESQFPNEYRHIKSAIKYRYQRRNRRTRGPVAKVGAGVGRHGPPRRSGRNKGGVGLGGRNIHWGVLGTDERLTATGAYRGRMPAILAGVVDRGWSASKNEVSRVIVSTLAEGIEREWKRSAADSRALPPKVV